MELLGRFNRRSTQMFKLKKCSEKKEKNKVGRPPKRNKNPTINQTIIDSFIQKACKNEEEKAEDRKMDIEK